MNRKEQEPSIAILLCTYNGEEFIEEQLDSYINQDYQNFSIFVSDDGSTDRTLEILAQYQQKLGESRLHIIKGPGKGCTANFISLNCNQDIQFDYYAYSDQDDIWESDKLSRSLQILQQYPKDVPALYGSRTRLVNRQNVEFGLSPLFTKKPGFANALVQSIAGGNTMLINKAGMQALSDAGRIEIFSHDWWAYMLIAGVGGNIHYDPYPSLRYRQHGANLTGANVSMIARISRINKLLQGRFRSWNDGNVKVLKNVRHLLTPENQTTLKRFDEARNSSLFIRLIGLWKTGVYRQTLLGNMGLIAAAILKKL